MPLYKEVMIEMFWEKYECGTVNMKSCQDVQMYRFTMNVRNSLAEKNTERIRLFDTETDLMYGKIN